jgi:hypothetical protein
MFVLDHPLLVMARGAERRELSSQSTQRVFRSDHVTEAARLGSGCSLLELIFHFVDAGIDAGLIDAG